MLWITGFFTSLTSKIVKNYPINIKKAYDDEKQGLKNETENFSKKRSCNGCGSTFR